MRDINFNFTVKLQVELAETTIMATGMSALSLSELVITYGKQYENVF